MKDYGHIYSSRAPQEIQMTNDLVFVASNIQPYYKIEDDREERGYEYDCLCYTKDEYIQQIDAANRDLKEQILITQEALSEIYEMLEG